MSRWKIRKDGEWVHWARKGHLVACCDCGLVHLFRPRLRAGRIEVQAIRLPRQTGGIRKARKLHRPT
jgi:hypothetical protein